MMKLLVSSALVMTALSAVGTAQQEKGSPVSVSGQPQHASLDMATGVVTRGAQEKAAGLVITWANTDYSGWTSWATVPSEEWLDWGTITATSGSDIVGEFQFAYGTTVLDTTAGGPGANLCTSFYSGAVGWCAESGLGIMPDAQYCWSGLPGTTSTAVIAGWIITVDLTGGFEFQFGPGAFGFTESFTDLNTGPLLCYAGSAAAGFDANGQEDGFDVYVPDMASGTCTTYWFGGVPDNYSSWWLYIATADGSSAATCGFYCGSGVNANGFVVSSNAVLGGTFVGSITPAGANVGAFLAAFSTPLTLLTGWGEILVNIADGNGELLGMPTAFGNPAVIALGLPINLAFCGFTFYVQAVGFGGSIILHCAYACTVGF